VLLPLFLQFGGEHLIIYARPPFSISVTFNEMSDGSVPTLVGDVCRFDWSVCVGA